MQYWQRLTEERCAQLGAELKRELSANHPLRPLTLRAIACRVDCDTVAFETPEGRLFAVHLTWHVETDPRWPSFLPMDALLDTEDPPF